MDFSCLQIVCSYIILSKGLVSEASNQRVLNVWLPYNQSSQLNKSILLFLPHLPIPFQSVSNSPSFSLHHVSIFRIWVLSISFTLSLPIPLISWAPFPLLSSYIFSSLETPFSHLHLHSLAFPWHASKLIHMHTCNDQLPDPDCRVWWLNWHLWWELMNKDFLSIETSNLNAWSLQD